MRNKMTISGAVLCVFLIALIILVVFLSCACCESTTAKAVWISVGIVLCLVTVPGFLFYYNRTESGKRAIKTEKSNLSGGINRTVTVYDYNGNQIDSWTGIFDVTNSEYETYFDIDGKRVVIHGGIVINEER